MESDNIEVGLEENEFYFESDHLALKGNKDYMTLLKTIVILEAQRTQALKDLDELLTHRKKALEDPISFVTQLQNGDLPTLPGPNKVVDLPFIDWNRYTIAGSSDARVRPQTRHANFVAPPRRKDKQENGKILVRGRAFDESKPETFNQLWTNEEQRRLEELLVEYPPEEIEMNRWKKIANALGNRNATQVSSRVQKYFIKLVRAGLPIPGRGPKVKMEMKRSLHHRHQRSNHFLFRKSTFFPHQNCMVDEKYDEDLKDPLAIEDSSDDLILDENVELKQIELLRRIKAEKEEEPETLYQHFGYKCYVCGEEPLKGTRWNCTECHDVNLCGDCAVAQLEASNPAHPPSHNLKPICTPESLKNYDTDYFPHNFDNSSYNYLDPNFLPE